MNYKNMYLNAVATGTKSSLMRNKQHLPPLRLSRPRGAPKKLDIGKALKYKSEAQKLVVAVFERAGPFKENMSKSYTSTAGK